MTAPEKDTARALAASRRILDGRGAVESSAILVTLDHTIATVLLALYRDPVKAAKMLNEGVLEGVEERLARYKM